MYILGLPINIIDTVVLIAAIIIFFVGLIKQNTVTVKIMDGTKVLQFPMASVILILYLFDVFYIGFYSLLVFVEFASFAFLAFMLITNKRNKLLLVPFAVHTLLCVYYSVLAVVYKYPFELFITSLMHFVAFAFTLVLVFLVVNPEEKYNKLSEICKKYRYLPTVLLIIDLIISVVVSYEDIHPYGYPFVHIILWFINHFADFLVLIGFMFLFTDWLINPNKKRIKQPQKVVCNTSNEYNELSANNDIAYDEAYCGLGKHIVLCLFTFGIWYLIWTYRTTKFLNKTPNAEQYNPTSKLLLCMFVPFYQIYWMYKHGQRIDTFSKYKKLNNSDMATMCLILGIFIPIVACILMQDRINTICTTKTPDATFEKEKTIPVTDELKKFKELLDMGVITQEEFDAKKKQLLGL